MKKLSNLNLILFIFILIFSSSNCKKSSETFPNVAVDVYVDLNTVDGSRLNTIGNYVYLGNCGYNKNGIIVYRLSQDEFKAYDRTCTYNISNNCRVRVDASSIFAIDSCCGSKFLLMDGSVSVKPATIPLKEYSATLNGTILHIYH